MKKNLLLTAVLIAFLNHAFNAQTIIDFENLVVPVEGFYNGSSDHSGTLNSTETFNYFEDFAEFSLTYTLGDGYDYWNGFAYSTQTDLITADWNNYSSYASPAGGANGSETYSFSYIFLGSGDSIAFSEVVTVNNFYIANSVWAYHYMNGTDGVGLGEYTSGDSLTLVVKGITESQTYSEDSVIFYLADFTNGNSAIIDNWTEVDLNSLGNVIGLKFELHTSDDWTPSYLCFDHITCNSPVNITKVDEANISVYPNPATNLINITNFVNSTIAICDVAGKTVFEKSNCSKNEQINISSLVSGIYFIRTEHANQIVTKKLIVK